MSVEGTWKTWEPPTNTCNHIEDGKTSTHPTEMEPHALPSAWSGQEKLAGLSAGASTDSLVRFAPQRPWLDSF